MNILRRSATALLWVLAAIGVACGAIWAATAAGVIQPLVVISGSMEPGIMTGDLLVATRADSAGLAPGDVVSLPSPSTGVLITHRIVDIATAENGFLVHLKGDANADVDPDVYRVGATVWKPAVQVPGAGAAVLRMSTAGVALPLAVGLVALLGITLLIPVPVPVRRDPVPVRHLAGIPS